MTALSDLTKIVLLLLLINVLILISWGMKKFFTFLPNSIPRKFLHVTAISVAAYSFILIENQNYLFALGLLILGGNYMMVKKGLFENEGSSNKNYGIFLVPVSYLLLVIFFNRYREIALLSMLILAFSDGFAALIGENFPYKPYKLGGSSKTLSGSLVFGIFTLLFFIVGFYVFTLSAKFLVEYSLWEEAVFAIYFTVIITFIEALSHKGLDNLLIPLFSSILFYIFFYSGRDISAEQLAVALLLVGGVIAISAKAKFLASDGLIAASVMGLIIFGLGGFQWAVPLLVFFFFSSFLSKLKKIETDAFEKSSVRDAFQVLANGAIPTVLMLMYYYRGSEFCYLLYLTALAAAAADTWGTEIGNLAVQKTVSLINFREVEQGLSGGVSILGSFGSLLGAFFVALSGLYWVGADSWEALVLVVAFGFLGMAVDSLLGALLQRKNRCTVCGKLTEKSVHCGVPTEYYSGVKWLNNDAVNLISIAISVILFWLIYFAVLK